MDTGKKKFYYYEVTETYKGKEFNSYGFVCFLRSETKEYLRRSLKILIETKRLDVNNVRVNTGRMTVTGLADEVHIKIKLREIAHSKYWLQMNTLLVDAYDYTNTNKGAKQ